MGWGSPTTNRGRGDPAHHRDAEGAQLPRLRHAADKLSLATAGIAAVTLSVVGKASHSGSAPERRVNALYELAHQVLQTKDLSDPKIGVKMNWTMASAGVTRNMIPPRAEAAADVRVLRRLYLATRLVMDISQGKAPLK
jgi:acetylornithine deacetylase/succinyl-diaminopimelate desuccinylase-like protein